MDRGKLSHRNEGGSSSGGPRPWIAERLATPISPSHERSTINLGRAFTIAQSLKDVLSVASPGLSAVAVGGLRRFVPTVERIELLVTAVDAAAALEAVAGLLNLAAMRARTSSALTVEVDRAEAVIRVVTPAQYGPALLHHTGSADHVAALESLADARGWRLSRDAFYPKTGSSDLAASTEEAIYQRLGLPFIAPELREGTGEIEAALAGALPLLVTPADIRGDLHLHTTWSDGRHSLEVMVRACQTLGYEYVAITDHSSSASSARGLDVARLRQQMEAVDQVRRLVPGITILHGSEVDILPSGRLDYPDAVLERLDIVLASLHDAAGHDRKRLTERYVAAMRHPLVNIITHPTNRMVGQRPPYDLDFATLCEMAAETGTALEIDGAPAHLDMDGAHSRQAIAAGAMVAIDSDCHRADWLERQMSFGVATARRGWVRAADVINTRPLAELRELLAQKRVAG